MKNILVNVVNQKGAGPKNISLQFLELVASHKHVFCIVNSAQKQHFCHESRNLIVYRPPKFFLFKAMYYCYFYYFWLPFFVLKNNIYRYLVFGNYLHGIFFCRSRVLIHHPYLFDLRVILKSSPKILVLELARFVAFRALIILRPNVSLVVQTLSMQRKLESSVLGRFPSRVIGNPMSGKLTPVLRGNDELYTSRPTYKPSQQLRLGYISRYYPHKRFDRVLRFIDAFRQYNIPFSVVVTLDDVPDFLTDRLHDYPELVNLGELDQANLQGVYEELDATIFLSERETFGNPILESLRFGLPVFGLDLDYFHDFITDHDSLLINRSPSQMAESVARAVSDPRIFEALVSDCLRYSRRFRHVDEWVAEMIDF